MKMTHSLSLTALLFVFATGCGTTNIDSLAAFRSDNTPYNAIKLRWRLIETNSPPIEALEVALDSSDYQQRQFAASVLRSYKDYEPSDRLLEVTVKGLAHDQLPYEQNDHYCAYTFLFNAADGTYYLMDHGPKAKKHLLKGTKSEDRQMQYLCAYLLGVHGIRKDIELTSSILIRHLRDNNISGDAAAACSALYRLGDAVIPYLKAAMPSDDTQQSRLITLIYNDLTDVPFNERERALGTRDAKVSSQYRDPAVNLVMPEFYFPAPAEWR